MDEQFILYCKVGLKNVRIGRQFSRVALRRANQRLSMVPWFAVRMERSKELAVTSESPLLLEGHYVHKSIRQERVYAGIRRRLSNYRRGRTWTKANKVQDHHRYCTGTNSLRLRLKPKDKNETTPLWHQLTASLSSPDGITRRPPTKQISLKRRPTCALF